MSRLILDGLRGRDAAGKPIRTGVMGAGAYGVGLVAQLAQAPGMVPAAVADLDVDAARDAYVAAGFAAQDVVRAENVGAAADAVRDLAAGTLLNGMGGNLVLGLAESADVALRERLLPLGLANQVRLRRPVAADAVLTYDDLEAYGDTPCWRLRREQGLLVEERAAVAT